MRVGYTIVCLASPEQEKEFARFLREKMILEEGYAENIAKVSANGDKVNIYTRNDYTDAFIGEGGYDFVATFSEITVNNPVYLVASAVDFRIELKYFGGIKVLAPTEYFTTTYEVAMTYAKEVKQGLVRIFPDPIGGDKKWILDSAKWNDEGTWVDEENWKD